MQEDFIITAIDHVISVGPDKYREEKTEFRHTLKSHELIFHFSGTATVYFGDQVLETAPNTIRFLPKGSVSRYTVHRKSHGSCIDIFFQTDRPLSPAAFTATIPEGSQTGLLFQKLFSLWVTKEPGSYFECISILYRILVQLQRHSYVPEKQMLLIEPALNCIREEFLARDLHTEELAELCGISYSYLKKLFLRRFGVSPKQYIIQLKLNHACDLLKTRQYTVSQVADQCGYRDVSFFSRQFKEYMGIPPSQYGQ